MILSKFYLRSPWLCCLLSWEFYLHSRLLALGSVAGVGMSVVVLAINGLLYFVSEVVVSDCLVPMSTMDSLLRTAKRGGLPFVDVTCVITRVYCSIGDHR